MIRGWAPLGLCMVGTHSRLSGGTEDWVKLFGGAGVRGRRMGDACLSSLVHESRVLVTGIES